MARNEDPSRRSGIKSLHTAFDVVETLAEVERGTVSELAERTPYTVSTVYEHLATLERLGYVLKEADKTYRLSTRFLELGTRVRRGYVTERLVRSTISNLAEETGEVVWFTVEEHGLGVNLYKAIGARGIQTYGREGKQVHMHCSAAGKAMLAAFTDDRIESILAEHGLPAYTDATITDEDRLRADIETVRERGYAQCDCETLETVRAVGAAVSVDDRVVGAVTVGGPANRLRGDYYDRELPEQVLEHANELELRVKYQ